MASATSSLLAPTIGFCRLPKALCVECESAFPVDITVDLPAGTTKTQARELKTLLATDRLNFRSSIILSEENRRDIKTRFPRIEEDKYLNSLSFRVQPNQTNTSFSIKVKDRVLNLSCPCTRTDEGFVHPPFYHRYCINRIQEKEGSITCRMCHKVATWQLVANTGEETTRENFLAIESAKIPRVETLVSYEVPKPLETLVTFPCPCLPTQGPDPRYRYKPLMTVSDCAKLVQRQLGKQLESQGKELTRAGLSSDLTHHKFSCITCNKAFWLSKELREVLERVMSESLRGPASVESSDTFYTPLGSPELRALEQIRQNYYKDTTTPFHRAALLTLTDHSEEGYREQADRLLRDAARGEELLNASIVTIEEREREEEAEMSAGVIAAMAAQDDQAANLDEAGTVEAELTAEQADSDGDRNELCLYANDEGDEFYLVDQSGSDDENGVVTWHSDMEGE